jgi:hypothetical protein
MRVRLGIKGMDRLGQDVLRTVERREPASFVFAMNDLAPAETVAHLVCRGRLRHPPDVIGEAASCLTAKGLPWAAGDTVKVFGRRDDERGHAPGILDLVDLIARTPDR